MCSLTCRVAVAAPMVLALVTPSMANAYGGLAPIPLGVPVPDQSGDRTYGVYVPTRFGGVLTVATTAGKVGPITGPDGRPRANGEDVGTDAHGWYTFGVTGAERPYTVEVSFVQVGQSARKPWNFYYWPTKGDTVHEPWAGGNARADTTRIYGDDILPGRPGDPVAPGADLVLPGPNGLLETPPAPGDDSTWFPNLYDDLTCRGSDGTVYETPAPLLKYDQIFRTAARGWEAAHAQSGEVTRWPGHCLGGAVASILLDEPVPAPGSGLTRDELKALWAELGENHLNQRVGAACHEIPLGPPAPGPDPTDAYAPLVHSLLESVIRGSRRALLGNLRAFPPSGLPEEVWNHAVGRYTARYRGLPGRDGREVRVDVELEGNSGSTLAGNNEEPRIVNFTYIITYDFQGNVDRSPIAPRDWIAVGGEALYCPLNLMEIIDMRWQGHNPYVSESNVRSLDLANGGASGGPAVSAPNFLPVASYEPTPMTPAAPAGVPKPNPPQRGGLFGRLLGR